MFDIWKYGAYLLRRFILVHILFAVTIFGTTVKNMEFVEIASKFSEIESLLLFIGDRDAKTIKKACAGMVIK